MAAVSHYYQEYHGHKIEHLEHMADHLPGDRGTVFLVGDSTLDNKYWIHELVPACNGYEKLLQPAKSIPDVAYCINKVCKDRGLPLCCINAAIEESTIGLRQGGVLLPHDSFVQRRIKEGDVLLVSCGGNDIALRPTAWTVISMVTLLLLPRWAIEHNLAPGLGHFVRLFKDSTEAYIRKIIRGRRPVCVVVCMLYYLDMRPGGSWADFTLQKLGYDKDPTKLQLIMRQVYQRATERIRLEGTEVVAVPLYEALDGTDSNDYVQRVEPSAQGGRKLATLIMDRLQPVLERLWSRDDSRDASGGGAGGGGGPASGRAGMGSREGAAISAMPTSVHNRGDL